MPADRYVQGTYYSKLSNRFFVEDLDNHMQLNVGVRPSYEKVGTLHVTLSL
jgi:hypothetical protein